MSQEQHNFLTTMREFVVAVRMHSDEKTIIEDTLQKLYDCIINLTRIYTESELYKSGSDDEFRNRINKEVDAGTRKPFQNELQDTIGETFFYFMQLLQRLEMSFIEMMQLELVRIMKTSDLQGDLLKR